jgi:hypothetical protein
VQYEGSTWGTKKGRADSARADQYTLAQNVRPVK